MDQERDQNPIQPAVALGQMMGDVAAMYREQAAFNRQFLGMLQNQMEHLISRPTVAPSPAARSPLAGITLHKMSEADDPQSFLEMFEATAEACEWPAEEWAVRLLPLLSGEAQTAALGLPPAARAEYRHLRDAATRWLQPGGSAAEDTMLGKVVLEQLIWGLPDRTSAWVRYHWPATLEAAVTLAEDHLAVHPGGQGGGNRSPTPNRQTPAPHRRAPPQHHNPAQPPPAPRSNINLSRSFSPQFPAATSTAPNPQETPRMPGQECWRCGQLGHFREACPLMEVGQVIRVAGPATPSPGAGATYRIPTDASNRGLGAVLSQQVGGVDHPVLYISRKLSEREARYSTIEKECLAIRWAVDTLRYYLLGRPFTLCSDHAPLQWLHRMKDANARITRWYLALQPFKFKVIHRPGAQMAVADFLSRLEGGE
ncbi:uncharacterized protein LOC117764737 [Hippoglossus hippoglossus]|uniref:uncharacterized protein LOC117764737 n=1 Tax=Hippoglossus hippoglossus TaxID=8267 RepID=UPI00148BC8B9|nr:uncharacterized protein LOC117764737 [Hippoglossus hippoglossus]